MQTRVRQLKPSETMKRGDIAFSPNSIKLIPDICSPLTSGRIEIDGVLIVAGWAGATVKEFNQGDQPKNKWFVLRMED